MNYSDTISMEENIMRKLEPEEVYKAADKMIHEYERNGGINKIRLNQAYIELTNIVDYDEWNKNGRVCAFYLFTESEEERAILYDIETSSITVITEDELLIKYPHIKQNLKYYDFIYNNECCFSSICEL